MRKYGECIYGCDYAGLEKQDWGYYTRHGENVYMVVFNRPYSSHLIVKSSKGEQLVSAELLDGTRLKVTETARDEYHVNMPVQDPSEPFVIRLHFEKAGENGKKYREALI